MLIAEKILCKRGIWEMLQDTDTSESTEQNDSRNGKLKAFFNKHQYIMGVATSLTASAIMSFISSSSIINSIPDRFNSMEENVRTLTTDFPKLSEDLKSFKEETSKNFENASSDLDSFKEDTSSSLTNMNDALSNLEESTRGDLEEVKKDLTQDIKDINDKLFNIAMNVKPTENTAGAISTMAYTMETEDFSVPIFLANSGPIATNNVTQEEYTASQLAGQKLIMSYINEKEQEVFFLGQFNKNNQWDGDCLINIYENDNLVLITEGEYKNGCLLSYKQILPFTTRAKIDVWSISKRNIVSNNPKSNEIDYAKKDTYSIRGESLTYFANNKNIYRKKFSLDEATELNMITVQQFESTISSPLEGYYFGNTSNGEYNDDTGTSYMIKYFENGTVRTLYCGDFKNGTFNDLSNDAWYITKGKDTTYMYYKGMFENEEPLHNADSKFENYLTLNRIDEILIENNFNHKLNWDES